MAKLEVVVEDDDILILAGMAVLKDCVRAGRKVKEGVRMSLKGKPFAVSFKIPFRIMFSKDREDNADTVRRMLKADAVYVEESGFDGAFVLSDMAQRFPYFGGDAAVGEVSACLWLSEELWV